MYASVSILHEKVACSSRFVFFFCLARFILWPGEFKRPPTHDYSTISHILYWNRCPVIQMIQFFFLFIKANKFMKQTILPQCIFITLNDNRANITKKKMNSFFCLILRDRRYSTKIIWSKGFLFGGESSSCWKHAPTNQKSFFILHFLPIFYPDNSAHFLSNSHMKRVFSSKNVCCFFFPHK